MTSHDTQHIIDIHEQLHSDLPPDPALRVKALESLLVEKGLLNIRSSIARALIGKEEGDSVEVTTPGGVKSYEILSVKYI